MWSLGYLGGEWIGVLLTAWAAVRQIATNCEFSILEDYKEAPLSRSPQHTH